MAMVIVGTDEEGFPIWEDDGSGYGVDDSASSGLSNGVIDFTVPGAGQGFNFGAIPGLAYSSGQAPNLPTMGGGTGVTGTTDPVTGGSVDLTFPGLGAITDSGTFMPSGALDSNSIVNITDAVKSILPKNSDGSINFGKLASIIAGGYLGSQGAAANQDYMKQLAANTAQGQRDYLAYLAAHPMSPSTSSSSQYSNSSSIHGLANPAIAANLGGLAKAMYGQGMGGNFGASGGAGGLGFVPAGSQFSNNVASPVLDRSAIRAIPNTVRAKEGGLIQYLATGGEAKKGYLSGGSSGQKDDIPAKLSHGEYVIDADVVSALGDGNNAAGAGALDKMRERIRAHKRAAPVSKIPPKAKRPEAYIGGK